MTFRLPQSPPELPTVAKMVALAGRALGAGVAGPTARGRYLHWDELRRRPPPDGLTVEQWWSTMKMARLAIAKELPQLRDRKGKPFRYCLIDSFAEALHRIDLGAGGKISLPTDLTNPDLRDRYVVSSLIEEAVNSSILEGAGTTRRIAAQMLRSRRPPENRGEQMVLNNYRAMEALRELRGEPMSPPLLFELHRILTEKTLDEDDAGRLRRPEQAIVVADDYGTVFHEPPAAGELPERLDRLCAFANEETPEGFMHPVLRAITLHFWLAYDHPFVDGNGRTARALFYWSMLRSGYWLFEFVSISHAILRAPTKYYRAFLHTETDANDLTYFMVYHLGVIERAMNALHDYLARKAAEIRDSESVLRGMARLNHRQKALVAHAVRHPGFEYTIESHRTSHAVAYQTARTDLLDLVDRALLRQHKRGRKFVFTPVPELAERLRGPGPRA